MTSALPKAFSVAEGIRLRLDKKHRLRLRNRRCNRLRLRRLMRLGKSQRRLMRLRHRRCNRLRLRRLMRLGKRHWLWPRRRRCLRLRRRHLMRLSHKRCVSLTYGNHDIKIIIYDTLKKIALELSYVITEMKVTKNIENNNDILLFIRYHIW